jgi:hypothetical protein
MDHKIQATQHWPLWWRVAVAAVAVLIAYLIQIPLEHQVPGEPFLLFSLVVISATLAFGSQTGFIAVGLSTLLSFPFFEPHASFFLVHASDLISIELYAILGAGCVFAFSRLGKTLTNPQPVMADASRLTARTLPSPCCCGRTPPVGRTAASTASRCDPTDAPGADVVDPRSGPF